MSRRGLRGAEDADELRLYLDNTESLYRRRQAIETNLAKKVCKGVFVTDRAAIAFTRLATEAASSYKSEIDRSARFAVKERRKVGAEMAKEFKENVLACRRGSCGDLSKETIDALSKPGCDATELRGARRRR